MDTWFAGEETVKGGEEGCGPHGDAFLDRPLSHKEPTTGSAGVSLSSQDFSTQAEKQTHTLY